MINIKNSNISINDNNKNILEALIENKIYINNSCNGKGTCGKCKIKILKGKISNITETEKSFLTKNEIDNNIRLACMTRAISDIEIEIVEKEKKAVVLTDSFVKNFVKDDIIDGLGLAIDIGTTTVVVELIDLLNGNEISNSATINTQKKYGLDVLTRITYENENGEEGIKSLQIAIIECINSLIINIVNKTNIDINKIKKIVISSNCTMMHMFLGIDARNIGRYPYTPVFTETKIINAKKIGLKVNDECICICLPHVSSFIGADIVSGVYACDIQNKKGNILFVDIGTNAEIVLKTNNEMVSCSCAAGPALEGMNITKGMRAEAGAIEDVKIFGDEIKLKIIGNEKPEGLCGSGILALIKEMIRNGIIKKNGAIMKIEEFDKNDERKNRIKIVDNRKEYILDYENNINITQSDIRQIQLAKAAILSGFTQLLNATKTDMKQLDKILIAGQFGAHLPASDIVGVGILPKEVESKIEYVGNVSKAGAYITLMSKKALKEMEEISKKIKYIELADTENYEKIFVKSMEFSNCED